MIIINKLPHNPNIKLEIFLTCLSSKTPTPRNIETNQEIESYIAYRQTQMIQLLYWAMGESIKKH
jgi:hypothetical protein